MEKPDPTPAIPLPKELELLPLNWKIINNDNFKDKLPQDGPWAVWALDAKNYENISENKAEVIRWVCEAIWQLKYYRQELTSGELIRLEGLCGDK